MDDQCLEAGEGGAEGCCVHNRPFSALRFF